MEPKFENYVERRERCRAVRFTHADQASGIAELFNVHDWTLHNVNERDGDRLELTLRPYGGDEITVRRGDFIKEEDYVCDRMILVPRQEFQERFEPEPKSGNPDAAT
jgi:hypothetical protein